MAHTTKFIFVTGGVLSSLGKGLESALERDLRDAGGGAQEFPLRPADAAPRDVVGEGEPRDVSVIEDQPRGLHQAF